ncbi:cation-transporting P-type ATPase [Phormidium sp. FACHB-1136]|uniref:cation-translocating P-type ATPase n=1 Tax=Phormidium sp. FACHB-1136 TaxID=2692848 RepID=UPI001688DE76|nr:cation-transporting P-type ATPase [Phormidium sp. FACHB-1136]MBD2427567.1 cation-transporting P-type ATPase [Phormidium sp. FACHB-1136]
MIPTHRPIWTLPAEAVYGYLESAPQGLAEAEAQQRLAHFGPNELPEPAQRPLWLRFTDQLTHFMALLLWVAGILAFISHTPALGWAIWAVILINALFSFWQEFRAERALAALKNVLPNLVRVYRGGELVQLPARELVRGDVVQLEEGDRIPADARLVTAESLYLDISVLTGESLPVARNAYPVRQRVALPVRGGQPLERPGEQPQVEKANPAEISNLVLAGATVASGRGLAVVYATGTHTEFGQVARITTEVVREPSTLEVQVNHIVRVITAIALSMGVLIFTLTSLLVGMEIRESFIFAIGIIVALVPEGLLPTVTLALAMSVQRMVRRNALVRRLSAVETLSAVNVICTDKTGTLTKNEMTVRHLWLPPLPEDASLEQSISGDSLKDDNEGILPGQIRITGAGYDPTVGQVHLPPHSPLTWKVNLLLTGAALCSNARLTHLTAPSRWQEIGDPTEAALIVAAAKAGLNVEVLQQRYPRQREIPFDSRRRMMTVVLAGRDDLWPSDLHNSLPDAWTAKADLVAFTKGAPLEVVRHCQGVLRDSTVAPLTHADWEQVVAANDYFARQGFRVLGLAIRPGSADLKDMKAQDLEQGLIFVGLVAMFDPPRPEVPQAIAQCHQAGIRVTMVTGDYGLTAEAIAQQIGLVEPDLATHEPVRVITGDTLGHLSDAQLQQMVKYRSRLVFARMAPEHKLRLVEAYKATGSVVAVTGDGVNDAPALRSAHIGIAMGLNGTDVAREAADIVLTDDNFATIVGAIEEGRTVYQNIRKFITYILSSNVPELLPFLAMVALKIPPALVIMQILAIDLGTDMVPALALGAEVAEPGTMAQLPRRKDQPLMDRNLLLRAYGWLGLIEGILGMAAFFWVWSRHGYSLSQIQAVTPGLQAHIAPAPVVAIYLQSLTLTLAAIVAGQTGNVFACRSEKIPIWRLGWFSNPLIWLGIATEWILIGAIIKLPPLQAIFSTAPLNLGQWAMLLLCPPMVLGLEELRKALMRHRLSTKSPP